MLLEDIRASKISALMATLDYSCTGFTGQDQADFFVTQHAKEGTRETPGRVETSKGQRYE